MIANLNAQQQDLVVKNMGLVYHTVKKYYIRNSCEFEDMVSTGTIGLCKAARTFDTEKENVFATYASTCIKNELFMHFRKEQTRLRHLVEDAYLSDQDEGITIMDMIPDPKTSNIDEQLAKREQISEAVEYILNRMKKRSRTIILYSIAGIQQKRIKKLTDLSQSYISRILLREMQHLKNNYENKSRKEAVYKVAINDGNFELSFSTTDIQDFNKAFAQMLIKTTATDYLPRFRINCTKERVTVFLPAEKESFVFIARLVETLETFSMVYSGNKNKKAEDKKQEVEAAEEETEAEAEEETEAEAEEKTEAEAEEETKAEAEEKTEAEAEEETEAEAEEETEAETEKEGEIESAKTRTMISDKALRSGEIKKYLRTLSKFTVKELHELFPNTKGKNITNAIYSLKDKGLIENVRHGVYRRVKKK